MAPNLRAVHTIGINLRHWERLAGWQSGYVHRLDVHKQSLTWELLHLQPDALNG
jgi:hypothetical protein